MTKTIRRRRLENKTDYKSRFHLLKAEKPRLVVRKTNKYIVAQIIESEGAQDKVLAKVTSKDLLKKGWPNEKSGSLKSIPAAYLTGYLLIKTLNSKIDEAIFDIGLQRNHKGSRLFAALNGAVDAGLNIPHNPESFPDKEKIENNENLKTIFQKVKGAI